MEHLTKALEKMAKARGESLPRSYLGKVYEYVRTGDERLMPALLRLDDADMNSLCQVAKAVARPDKWGAGDLHLIQFFVRRSAVLNGVDKGAPQGECSDWPLPRCLERHLEAEKPEEDFCGLLRAKVLALGVPELRWLVLVARHVESRAVNGRLTSAGRYLAAQPVAKLLKVLPALRYQCTDKVFMPALAAECPQALA